MPRGPKSRKRPADVKRKFGTYRGEFEVPDGFFEPLPESELAAFEGSGSRGQSAKHLKPNP